jgi:hypothetical protein
MLMVHQRSIALQNPPNRERVFASTILNTFMSYSFSSAKRLIISIVLRLSVMSSILGVC